MVIACASDDGDTPVEPPQSSVDATTDTVSTDATTDAGLAVGNPVCDPGQTQPCVCPEGEGAQSCNGEGTDWEPCVCVEAEVDAGAPTETCDYTGGWPCNPDKETMADPGWEGTCPGGAGCDCVADGGCASSVCVTGSDGNGRCSPATGTTAPRLKSVDQFGDLVDLYDFAGHDTPVVITLSAGWAMAGQYENWLKGDDTVGVSESWSGVRTAVLTGELTWITLLVEDANQSAATSEFQADWHEAFGFSAVPLLLDTDYKYTLYYSQYGSLGLPALLVFDGDLQLLANGVLDPGAVDQVLTGLF
jgi:hypothetical protein